jgi:hypothetical protein
MSMHVCVNRTGLAVALGVLGLLCADTRAGAQEPQVPSSSPATVPAPERRGSPVETLESLTGERVREGGEGADEIETDRDSFTPATTIAGRRRFIVESAYSFVDNRGVKETHSFPELLLRYGLTDRVELRLGWNAEIGGAGSEVTGSSGGGDPFEEPGRIEREYNLAYGMKFRLTDQNRWFPRSIVIVQAFTPTGGSAGTSTATALITTYAAGWTFANQWRFDAAMRYGLDSERGDHFNQWAPSAVLRVPLGEKLATHVEYFGIFTSGKERNRTLHYISPGVHYLLTPDFEFGVRVGWGLNDQSARFFTNVGFGWRF